MRSCVGTTLAVQMLIAPATTPLLISNGPGSALIPGMAPPRNMMQATLRYRGASSRARSRAIVRYSCLLALAGEVFADLRPTSWERTSRSVVSTMRDPLSRTRPPTAIRATCSIAFLNPDWPRPNKSKRAVDIDSPSLSSFSDAGSRPSSSVCSSR